MRRTAAAVVLSLLVPALAAADGRPVSGGSVSFSFAPDQLATFGFTVEAVEHEVPASVPDAALAFEAWTPAGMTARVEEGRFVSYDLGLVLEAAGGFDLAADAGRLPLRGFELRDECLLRGHLDLSRVAARAEVGRTLNELRTLFEEVPTTALLTEAIERRLGLVAALARVLE